VNKRILVIAPHLDDEVLGVGGTISRFVSQGAKVYVAVVTKGFPPYFSDEEMNVIRTEARAAHEILGVTKTLFLDFPAASLDAIRQADINNEITRIINSIQPNVMFIPFIGDIHRDHKIAFISSLVGARPNRESIPEHILCYETLSETNWNAPYITPNFVPNVYVDIGKEHLNTKLSALSCYKSQIRPFPNERSLKAIEALATLRGATIGCSAAEGFVLVRSVFKL